MATEQVPQTPIQPGANASIFASGGEGSSTFKQMQDLAASGDAGAIEHLFNYYATKDSEQTARDWTAQREDTAYSRLVNDLQKAGISPYILSGATPTVSQAQSHSYTGSSLTSRTNNAASTKEENRGDTLDLIGNIIRIVGTIGSALIFALMG